LATDKEDSGGCGSNERPNHNTWVVTSHPAAEDPKEKQDEGSLS